MDDKLYGKTAAIYCLTWEEAQATNNTFVKAGRDTTPVEFDDATGMLRFEVNL